MYSVWKTKEDMPIMTYPHIHFLILFSNLPHHHLLNDSFSVSEFVDAYECAV